MRLGILGGTLDPIHNAHLFIAGAAQQAARLEQVLFMPSGSPPHKIQNASAQDRLRMTELAVRPYPWASASALEVEREGTIYTVDSLELLRLKRPRDELFMIVGADALRDMLLWRDARRAMTMCQLVAVARPGMTREALELARKRAMEETGARVLLVYAESPDISSSQIRGRIAQGEAITGMVPEAVEEYIRQRGLYR